MQRRAHQPPHAIRLPVAMIGTALVLFVAAGCASPSAANIQLRKRNQQLEQEIVELERQREADRATIRALQAGSGSTPTLSADQLDRLFTTAGIRLGKLTGGTDLDRSQPGDEAVKVEIAPIDAAGDVLKSAGAVVVEVFDLARPDGQRIGRWEIASEELRKSWMGNWLIYGYVLTLPWQEVPVRPALTLKVTFTDELTGRQFTAQRPVTIEVPRHSPTTAPSLTGANPAN